MSKLMMLFLGSEESTLGFGSSCVENGSGVGVALLF